MPDVSQIFRVPQVVKDFTPNSFKIEGSGPFQELRKAVERTNGKIDIFNPSQTAEFLK
jgi:hypothetical protein